MSDHDNLVNLTKCLLESIVHGNWEAYAEMCDPTLTCFEPEALGCLVEGMDFHQFYFQLEHSASRKIGTTLASPHVRVMGDTAIVSYVRLTQSLDAGGSPQTRASEETRIWHRQQGEWKHVHFHRSPPTK
jgi:calcium/calmodulin-dependent protein kinase (CaM kinase) II